MLGAEVGRSCRSQGGQLRQQKSSPGGEADRTGEEEVEPKQRTQYVQRPRRTRGRSQKVVSSLVEPSGNIWRGCVNKSQVRS